MPNNKTINFYSLVIAFCLIAILHFYQKDINSSKGQKVLIRTSKLLPPIHAEIKKVENDDVVMGSQFSLRAEVAAHISKTRVRWAWSADPGVNLLNSKTTGVIEFDSARDTFELEMQFKQVSESNEKIYLKFFDDLNPDQVLGAFIYNSLNQEKIESESKEIAERQKIYIEEMGEGISVLSSEGEPSGHSHDDPHNH